MTTFDEAALELLLAGGPHMKERLEALAAKAKRFTEPECPECGGTDVGDNGGSGVHLAFCCNRCGEQWDAVEIA